jgi:hypothetical protein
MATKAKKSLLPSKILLSSYAGISFSRSFSVLASLSKYAELRLFCYADECFAIFPSKVASSSVDDNFDGVEAIARERAYWILLTQRENGFVLAPVEKGAEWRLRCISSYQQKPGRVKEGASMFTGCFESRVVFAGFKISRKYLKLTGNI